MYQVRISSSTLHTFLLCSKRYFYEQLLKVEQEDNIYGILGTAVHKIAKRLVDEYFPCDNNDKVVKQMRKFVIGNWRNIFFETVYDAKNLSSSTKEIERVSNEGYPIIQNLVSMISDQNLMNTKLIFSERKFEFPIFGGTVLLTGIIDLCLKDGKDYRIIDWKTQRKLPVIDNEKRTEYQLELYSLYIALTFKKSKVIAERWFLRHKEIHNYEITKEDLRQSLEVLEDVRNKILGAQYKEQNSEAACKYCAIGKKNCKIILKQISKSN